MSNQYKNEFLKVFNSLCTSRQAWQVWADWISATACCLSISCDRDRTRFEQRSKEFRECMDRIGDDMKAQKLFDIMTDALEADPYQDFLGSLYMELGLASHWHGQFFTPISLCKMMAGLTADDAMERLAEKNWISVNDPSCGAGATLIAAAEQFRLKGVNYQRKVLFVGQDIDRVTAQMCYIQLTLIGCPGYVIVANTLTNPAVGPLLAPAQQEHQEYWYTFMFLHDEVWQFRRMMYMTDLSVSKATNKPMQSDKGRMFIFTFTDKEVRDAEQSA